VTERTSDVLWDALAARASLELSAEQHRRLSRYLDLLLEANQTMNLTRIDDRAEAERLHVGDSLTLLPFIPRGEQRIADVGSGGGVPGIPLAIARPDSTVTLIESTRKKAAFLTRAIQALELSSIEVFAGRVEDLAHSPRRESFDVVTARALAMTNVLAEWCLPLVRKGGKLLAMKGAKVGEELLVAEKAIRALNGAAPRVHPANLPGAENHVIVEIVKAGRTDRKYPRPAAQVKARPLGSR
jgi:16S rRNA (guanine527-N7)-methyltransferase